MELMHAQLWLESIEEGLLNDEGPEPTSGGLINIQTSEFIKHSRAYPDEIENGILDQIFDKVDQIREQLHTYKIFVR